MSRFQHIYVPYPDITLYTDSRTLGWGVTMGKINGKTQRDRWKADKINQTSFS